MMGKFKEGWGFGGGGNQELVVWADVKKEKKLN